MSAVWREEDEFKVGGAKGGLRSKPRFSFTEVKVLLDAVKRNRFILLSEWKGKFNQGVSAEAKKQTWTEITNQINGLGENHREVRQIMKKWADLKGDGKRRALALRSPNGNNMKKKNLGPIERMVYKILIMSPRAGGDSDLEMGEDEDFSKLYSKGPPPNTTTYSYLSLTDSSHSVPGGGASFDLSPLSSPEKDLDGNPFHMSSDLDMGDAGEYALDFEENDDSMFFIPQPPPSASLDPLPDNALLRMKPVHTYSRNSQSNTTSTKPPPPVPFFSGASTSSVIPSATGSETASSAAAPPPSQPLISSTITFSLPAPSSSFALPPPPSSSSPTKVSKPAPSIAPPPASSVAYIAPSSSILPPSISSANRDPLPAGGAPCRTHDAVAQMASQGLEQQRASRMLLSSVSQSLEVLAQSVQLLVESQQEFVQDSLQLQRETVDILRDFSNTAITMLRDKTTNHPPAPRF
ncbi:wiskott-Aldrich syndrome protein homolog 1-like isoform X1 [Gymnodraco acuticeps]|uniref:Wiskott-Aldrich syndrome protein homolog 1-like isoform X1 n=2 Tax=Gymnodraco acuticeps TaxID=8218 RepID=A0A6P8WG17_GYMAC|nr:wiskott-Aldrich syndrome protein homolog 1-like isoform X1 [Gymnodraco acuticeps]XP_034086428.1 wiskott-Aldrich syndrome protein homolog 1-like isoform X1 [Gymnodraco acuticeps]XP_034086429.1 wiskott-Aldrich syndrome protein homolog 1-like isoform X1 [Gymnodraco acuticeps]